MNLDLAPRQSCHPLRPTQWRANLKRNTSSPQKIFYGWYIVAACFALYFLFAGAGFYSFSIFIKPIESEFGWPRSAIALTMSIYLIIGGLMAPVFGRLVERYGPRKVMRAAAMASGACFMMVSLTRSLWYFYGIYALLAVSICGMGVIPISHLLANWFDKRRGTALGTAMVGISVGGLLLAPGIGWTNAHFGWKASFLAMGVLVWLLALPLIQYVIKNQPSDMGLGTDGDTAPPPHAKPLETPRPEIKGHQAATVLRSRPFWCIFTAFFLAPFAQMGVLQHQVPMIMETGISEGMAATVLGLTAGIGGLGKLSFGRISETWTFRNVVLLCFGLQALALALLLFTHSIPMVWGYALIFGFSMGGVVVLIPLVVGHYWGLLSYGVLIGVIWVANALGGSLGTYISGLIYDCSGNYRYALYLFLTAYLVAIPTFFLAGKPKPC